MSFLGLYFIASMLNLVSGYYVQPDVIKFLTHPQSQIAVQASPVYLECSIDKTLLNLNLPQVHIAWYHNGSLVESCNSTQDQGSVIVSTCTIGSAQISDIGWYQCRVIDGDNETLCHNLECVRTVTSSQNAYVSVIGLDNSTYLSYHLPSNCTNTILQCLSLNESILTNYIFNFELIWRKNEELIQNNTLISEILPSRNLLLKSNMETISQLTGIYQCLFQLPNSSNEFLITQITVYPPTNVINPNDLPDVTLAMYSLGSVNSSVLLANSSLELVCHYKNLCNTLSTTWSHNEVNINFQDMVSAYSEDGVWLRWDAVNIGHSGNYCCSVNGVMNETRSCIHLHVIDSDPIPNEMTIFIDETNSTPQLNCSSTYPIQWTHNGQPINHNTLVSSLTLTNDTILEKCGIYQCIIDNSSINNLALYRVLPRGWTNPVSLVSCHAHPYNYGQLMLSFHLPIFTGGLDPTHLFVSIETIVTEDGPLKRKYFHKHIGTNTSAVLTGLQYGDYLFGITVVNTHYNMSISESKNLTKEGCTLYPPKPPNVTLLCGDPSSIFEWRRPEGLYQSYSHIRIWLECFNDSYHQVYYDYYYTSTKTFENITIDTPIGSSGTCNFTSQASRQFGCPGSYSTGGCYMTAATSVNSITVSTSTTSSINSIAVSTITSSINSITVSTTTSSVNSITVSTITTSSVNSIAVSTSNLPVTTQENSSLRVSTGEITTSNLPTVFIASTSPTSTLSSLLSPSPSSSVSPSLSFTSTSSPIETRLVIIIIIVLVITASVVFVLLALSLLCVVASKIWRKLKSERIYVSDLQGPPYYFEGGIPYIDQFNIDNISLVSQKTQYHQPYYLEQDIITSTSNFKEKEDQVLDVQDQKDRVNHECVSVIVDYEHDQQKSSLINQASFTGLTPASSTCPSRKTSNNSDTSGSSTDSGINSVPEYLRGYNYYATYNSSTNLQFLSQPSSTITTILEESPQHVSDNFTTNTNPNITISVLCCDEDTASRSSYENMKGLDCSQTNN